ncbi:MAG: proline iminopeptidase [Acidobacteriota bacterium]|jgi:proline iminopeptidase|nr:proline iminopeptidase [Acidobacteriota bacterium]
MLKPWSLAVVLALAVPLSAWAAAPAESGQSFPAGGVSLYYEVLGNASGTPLVVANGGPGFEHSYLHISKAWNELARHRPVVFYDQRGTGRSTLLEASKGSEAAAGLAEQIADLEALRQHLGAEKIDLLGHSWGGYLVMAYAARHPDRIRRLLIVDSAAPKWGDTLFLFKEVYPEGVARQNALAFSDELGDETAKADGMREYFSMLFYSPENRDAFLAAAGDFHYSEKVNKALNADLARFDLGPELPKYRFPTLVVTGRHDANVAPATAYRIHQAIPGSRFVVFEKSGHLPFFEEPARFVQVIEEFLGAKEN